MLFKADDVWFTLTAWRASSMSSAAMTRFAAILLYVSSSESESRRVASRVRNARKSACVVMRAQIAPLQPADWSVENLAEEFAATGGGLGLGVGGCVHLSTRMAGDCLDLPEQIKERNRPGIPCHPPKGELG